MNCSLHQNRKPKMLRYFCTITGSNNFWHSCCLFIVIAFFSVSGLHAQTELSGSIGKMSFSAKDGPYVVVDDITVPEGKKAVIKEGCVFLFKPFTGLKVHGDLFVEGTQENRVIFTSINDGEYNTTAEQLPNPFDWNGILVSSKSEIVSLKYFSLRFSVYGIKSQISDILIENGLFRQNGQFHFTIKDKIQYVQDDIAFSCNNEIQKTTHNESQHIPEKKQNIFVKKGIPVIIAGTGVASGVVSLVFLSKWANLRKKYSVTADPVKASEINNDAEVQAYTAIGAGTFSIAAIATGAVLYWRLNRHEEKKVTIAPVILPGYTGAVITVTMHR